MPPALHPRSIFTTSLFSTTLALSFIVVGLPHILPCPVDASHYAEGRMDGFDGQGKRRVKRRKTPVPSESHDDTATIERETASVPTAMAAGNDSLLERKGIRRREQTDGEDDDAKEMMRRTRECPVPKPGGVIGQLLGFKREETNNTLSKRPIRISAPDSQVKESSAIREERQ